jgi:hypothetical protein
LFLNEVRFLSQLIEEAKASQEKKTDSLSSSSKVSNRSHLDLSCLYADNEISASFDKAVNTDNESVFEQQLVSINTASEHIMATCMQQGGQREINLPSHISKEVADKYFSSFFANNSKNDNTATETDDSGSKTLIKRSFFF